MNEGLLDLINGPAGHFAALDKLAEWTATYGLWVLAAVIGLFGLQLLRTDLRRGLLVGAAGALALGIAGLGILAAGSAVNEDRPFLHDSDTHLLVDHGADNSFPSDHTVAAAAIATVAALAWRKRWLPFIGLAAAIGVARVFVGVHYPGDVFAGWVIGGLAGLIAWQAVNLWLAAPLHLRPPASAAS